MLERYHGYAGGPHELIWDRKAIDQTVRKLNPPELPPYLIGPPRLYTREEPWGEEVWEKIIKNAKLHEEMIELRARLAENIEKNKNE